MVVGPCIDDTDFKTLEEAIAYNAAGMDVSLIVEKTDGTTAVTAITLTTAGTSDWTHKDGGYYEIEVTAAQNAEEGIAYVRGVCTGVLPFESIHYNIVKANVYDSWIKGTDVLQTDVTQWLGTAVTANVAGQPTVDVTRVGASTQSLIDLKDFADSGYDPTANKINGVVLVDTTTTNTDMVGTDNAALAATALTDATWTDARAGYIDELAAANLPTDIADIPTVAEFEARSIVAADYVVVGDTLAAVTTVTNLTNAPTNGDLTATMKTSVNTEVADVIKTDTISEMAQGAPAATPTLEDAIMYLYMYFRNEVTQTATTLSLKNDGGTVIAKSTVSDDATTFTKGEMVSGP